MFRRWRRVFRGIKSIKYASIVTPFPVLRAGLRPRSGKLLIGLTGIILLLALGACNTQSPPPPMTKPIPAGAPTPSLAPGEKVSLDLLLVSGGYYRVTAGENATSFLEIRNSGNKMLTNIRLSSVEPEGWVVDFKPSRIDSLSPDNFQTLELTIKPGEKADKGGYNVTLIADATETRRVLDIWLTVETPEDYWLWIGGIILLLVVTGFILVYLRFGRQ